MRKGYWRITLGGDEPWQHRGYPRVWTETEWLALHMDERRRLLIEHKGSKTEWVETDLVTSLSPEPLVAGATLKVVG